MFQQSDVDSDVDLETFRQNYWRKKPVALGQVDLSRLEDLSFADLVSLAAESEVESRLLSPSPAAAEQLFELEFGPFVEPNLTSGNMLMIQNLESFSFDVSAWLSEQFSFLPRWRIEDVMATLANDGGSCGAHFDQYDVFLVQLAGEKTWQLDGGNQTAENLIASSEIRLLQTFEPEIELRQKTGDVLYIPPGVGHHGIASDQSITLSVGIRNPLLNEMAAHLADRLLMSDSSESLSDHFEGTGISTSEVHQLGQKLLAEISHQDLVSDWYGCYMTEPRDPELLTAGEDFPLIEVPAWKADVTQVTLDLPVRIAFQPGTLFINGESFPLHTQAPWLESLQQQRTVAVERIPEADDYILQRLISSGAVLT